MTIAEVGRRTATEKLTLLERQVRVKEAWDMVDHNRPDIPKKRLVTIVAYVTGEDVEAIIPLYLGEFRLLWKLDDDDG
jgi:hypothetical protein